MARVSFDRFDFDPHTLELHADGAAVPLQQQPARVLALLLARRGELVTRDELRAAVWGDDTFVDFNRSLNFCISQIRRQARRDNVATILMPPVSASGGARSMARR